ncbi:MAG: hypothetical protein HYY61_01520 [Deltaproteobacteria bacterium]|nr:hypothetical protein [Deltaproteobacteria bacterium]
MRRLITVFALIAALFILMGCGMGSKNSLEQGAPVDPRTSDVTTEVIQVFTLFSGMYNGKSGEIYKSDASKEDIEELYAARKHKEEKDKLSAQISDLENKLPDDSVHAIALVIELEVMKKSLEDLEKSREDKKSLEDLELLVAYHLTSLSFAIEMKEGKPEIDQLAIETAEDVEETIKVPGDEEGTTKEEKRMKRLFGDVIKVELNKEVTFDPSTGVLSFSFTGTQEDQVLIYTFEGKTSDQLVEKDEQKIREVSLSGEVKISEKDSEMLVIGNWGVSQSIDETPKKEELKEEEPEITTPDQK